MSAAELEKLAKYEEAIRELEAREADLARSRGGYMKIFTALALVSLAGFFWNVWAGAATLFTGVLMFIFGVYVVRVRAGDYSLELMHLRETAEELRSTMRAPSRPSDE